MSGQCPLELQSAKSKILVIPDRYLTETKKESVYTPGGNAWEEQGRTEADLPSIPGKPWLELRREHPQTESWVLPELSPTSSVLVLPSLICYKKIQGKMA